MLEKIKERYQYLKENIGILGITGIVVISYLAVIEYFKTGDIIIDAIIWIILDIVLVPVVLITYLIGAVIGERTVKLYYKIFPLEKE